ncbi:hypothetical protein [Weissella muntiaci]|nr:hypothetical protein [Weissella muntiaci]
MADKIDKILQSYFSGDMAKDIEARKEFVNVRGRVDDVTLENDPQLLVMQHHFNICKMWTDDLPGIRLEVIGGIYKKELTWLEASFEYNVSRTTIAEWRNLLKRHIKPWLFISTNENNK